MNIGTRRRRGDDDSGASEAVAAELLGAITAINGCWAAAVAAAAPAPAQPVAHDSCLEAVGGGRS